MSAAYQIDLDEQRSVGDILAATARLYRRYPLLFAILALGVVAPYELAVFAISGYGPLRSGGEGITFVLLTEVLRFSLITPLVSALHIHAVVLIGEGQRPPLGTVALRGLNALPVVAAASIIATIGISLGFIAIIIPGILLSIHWAVVAQAAALEDGGWLGALRSSGRLTADNWGHVFALLLLTGVLGSALSGAARAIPLGSTSGAGSVAVGIAVETIIASFVALTLALLYFDLRARSKGPSPGQTRRANWTSE